MAINIASLSAVVKRRTMPAHIDCKALIYAHFQDIGPQQCCGVCSEDSHIPALCSRYALAGCVHVRVRASYCAPPLSAQPVNIVVLSQAKGLE
jgi:hypothetical protein